MKPPLPYLLCNLVGYMTTRAVCLTLSRDVVRGLLPSGLELEAQSLTDAGTHPVAFHFSDVIGARLTVPNLLPTLTYCELIVSIPFVRSATRPRPETEPWSYLPRLFLNDPIAVAGGLIWYGFPKVRVAYERSDRAYRLIGLDGRSIVSLEYQPDGRRTSADEAKGFERMRQTFDRPIYVQMPFGAGPLRGCTHFERKWSGALVQRLSAVITIDQAFLPGLPIGRFDDLAPASTFGAFEVAARFRQFLVYPETVAGS